MLTHRLHNVAYAIISIEELRRLAQAAERPTRVHLKIDTGMHRHGILMGEIEEAMHLIRKNERIVLEGIYSHLADADTPQSPHAELQIERWNRAVRQCKAAIPGIRYVHISATSGVSYVKSVEANVMRLGLGLYGINVGFAAIKLRPALEVRSILSSVKSIPAGEYVGYNATHRAERATKIATIPVGYYEGIDRRLSSKGVVELRGVLCPIIGRVSMNVTTIDVSATTEARLSDEVVIISNDPHAPNSITAIAKACGTIPYEIMVHLPKDIRRTVV